jgi:hypothetical protein
MKIERLTLTNFRGVANRSLTFHPGFNLIVGVNGVGKTSVLDTLRVMLAHALQMFANAPRFNVEFQADDLMRGADEMTAEMTFSCHGEGPYTYLIKKGEERHINNPTGGLREQTSETPDIRKLWHADQPDVMLAAGPKAFKGRENQPLGVHFSVSRARATDERSKLGRSTNPGYFGAFITDRGLRVQDLVDWLRNKEQIAREAPKGNSARQKAAVLNAITTMVPELTDWRLEDGNLWVTKQVSRQRIDESSDTKDLHVVSEPMSLLVEELSDGERSLVVLGFDIAKRLAQLNPNDPMPTINGQGVVLIDEVDLHLHPQWQRRIIPSLTAAFPRVQFIATTHSPQVIGETPVGQAVLLREDGTSEVLDESLGRDSGWILRHVMDTPERNAKLQAGLDEIDRLMEEGALANARERVTALRAVFGDDKELIGANAAIDRWEILGDETDSKGQ